MSLETAFFIYFFCSFLLFAFQVCYNSFSIDYMISTTSCALWDNLIVIYFLCLKILLGLLILVFQWTNSIYYILICPHLKVMTVISRRFIILYLDVLKHIFFLFRWLSYLAIFSVCSNSLLGLFLLNYYVDCTVIFLTSIGALVSCWNIGGTYGTVPHKPINDGQDFNTLLGFLEEPLWSTVS
jgi:hypothetical protein